MGKRVIFNEDMDHFVTMLKECNLYESVSRKDVEEYVAQYADTSVTDFFMCINGRLSYAPSNVKTFFADRVNVKEELGQKVDYSDTNAKSAHTVWYEKNLDIYKIWIDKCREINIKPWISFRMNDVHYSFELPHCIVPEEYCEKFDKDSRIRHRRQMQYYDRAADYELEHIRIHMKTYIEEMLDRYDPYGIELDFQRELTCFGIGREEVGREIMTKFVGEIKMLVGRFEKKRGHEIKIAVRCHQKPEYCFELGFDIVEWAKRGYIDLYTAAPRFISSDMDIPIKLWKQILEPYGVDVAGGIEMCINHEEKIWYLVYNTLETAFALAASVLSQGGILYLFNYFSYETLLLPDGGSACGFDNRGVLTPNVLLGFLKKAGNLETICKENRKCIVTRVDAAPVWRRNNAQLPLTLCDVNEPGFIKIATGKITEGTVVLSLGIVGDINPENDIAVYVNSRPVKFVRQKECDAPVLTKAPVYMFEIEKDSLSENAQVAEIILCKSIQITVDYADIYISCK